MSESKALDLISNIPLAITSEILLKLPAESVVRSRCVSKLWSSITTDPYFTNTFETRSSTQPSLVVFFKKNDKLFVFSFPQHNSENFNEPHESYSSQHVESYHMKYPKRRYLSYTESVHGLICFREPKTDPIVWNPSTRQFLTLPKPGKKWKRNLIVFLGYDPIEGKHKVVCLRRVKDVTECRVLTLGSVKKSWRTVKTIPSHLPDNEWRQEQCINGNLYYHAQIADSEYDEVIMRFDVRTETFEMINYPSDESSGRLITYKGNLACFHPLENGDIVLWVLEDSKRQKWSNRRFFTSFIRSLKFYQLAGTTDTGEFICVPRKLLNSFFILYHDPVRNSTRRIEFKGIVDEEFRFSHGLGSKRLCNIFFFANHIETLTTL